jgi:uncharacterized lipoprotein YbaY
MKTFSFAWLLLALSLFLGGCAHLDTSPPASADRVLSGVVDHAGEDLPDGAEVTVRVLDLSRGVERGEVLGEVTIPHVTKLPVSFRVEYRAEDAQLMRTVNVEARISVGGRLRYTTTTGHPITLGNVGDVHIVTVQLASGR